MKKIFFSFIIFFLSLSGIAEAKKISSIRIEGNKRIEEQVILGNIRLEKGRNFDQKSVNDGVKNLYKLGYFSDIRVVYEEQPGGYEVVFYVKERPIIREIVFDGNKKVKEEDLDKEVDIKLFSILDQTEINKSIEKMKTLYDTEGYYLVEIVPVIKSLDSESVRLTFDISENKQVKIKKITILGNKVIPDSKIRKVLGTKEGNLLSFFTKTGRYQKEVLNSDMQRITYLYQDNGFLDVQVETPQIYLSVDRKNIYITFSIAEGEPYQVGNVSVSGDLIFPKEELLALLMVKKGETFRRSFLDQDVQKITEKYSDEGYFYVNVRPVDSLEKENRIVNLDLTINKGLKVYFERINFSGNSITRDKVIRRELLVYEGSLFSLSKLRKSLEAVKRLGYFEEVTPSTPRGSSDDKINLNLDVEEKPTGTFTIGAGFSSVDKFIFTAQVSKDNFFGLGIRGDLSAQVGGRRQLFNLSLTEPHFLDSPWLVGASAYRSDLRFTDFDRRSTGGEIRTGRRIWELISGSLAYRIEQVEVGDVDPTVQSFFSDGVTSTLVLGINRDSRDNRLFPKRGTFNTLTVQLAGGLLGGDNEFFKVRYNSRFFYPIFKDIIFRFQGRIGYIGSVSGKPVPIFERFFLGGINSLRGFRSRSISPTRQVVSLDPAAPDYEFQIGGNKELLFNTEIGFPIFPQVNIRGVAFVDAGNAFDDDENLSLTNLRTSWGFGVRWLSPLGPLRFEWGFPFKPKPDEDSQVFEFSIGSSF